MLEDTGETTGHLTGDPCMKTLTGLSICSYIVSPDMR